MLLPSLACLRTEIDNRSNAAVCVHIVGVLFLQLAGGFACLNVCLVNSIYIIIQLKPISIK